MKIIPQKCENKIGLPEEAVLGCIGECDATQLKVLIYLTASPEFDEGELCEKLDITKKGLAGAIDFWTEKGVFKKPSAAARSTKTKSAAKSGNVTVRHGAMMRAAELPRYTSEEVAEYVENNEQMQSLLLNCQQYMGKMFNRAEIEIVVGLRDYLKLDDDYILLLFSHCSKMNKKSLRYIEKLAVGLFDGGVLAYDELDEHLTAIEEAYKLEHKLRTLFGVGKRALTAKEKKAFETWAGKWKMPFALIERAYEITVENTGGASIPYCSAILEKWFSNGYTTVEQVDAAIEQYKHDKEGAKDKKGSFETDDFFEAALQRSYGKDRNSTATEGNLG